MDPITLLSAVEEVAMGIMASRMPQCVAHWARMEKKFNVVIERDSEGWLVASVPALAGCHTQSRSYDQLFERIREAIELCLEDDPEADSNEFLGVQQVAVNL